MEAERRSTMSSLKGQLSNVEGSVKSMKAAVVVGSVLTVACLAAVFGVTILANEVSKEVKVSNNTLTTKSGESVLTTSKVMTKSLFSRGESVQLTADDNTIMSGINAQVIVGTKVTIICDEIVLVSENGALVSADITKGSTLEAVLEAGSIEKRSMNGFWRKLAVMAVDIAVDLAWKPALDWALGEGAGDCWEVAMETDQTVPPCREALSGGYFNSE
ncbi:hypothetical protein HKI87_05g35010 [Chloropicon roscoffensis]|uniref:Uncharacterized protein n=1 Tax=Chloropicon roscoffensis TaxID=1461544 RepID=A0AAX4P7H7_9CHLO